ncbi:MAG: hypothetical protein NW200_01265 [Hyphomonadaceae bacterium]|nr:hypothetical protein [Hyphomonadaceae bacterium]
MEREIILVRDGVTVWQGRIRLGDKASPASVQEFFTQAWRLALEAGAVTPDDAGRVRFRFA